MKKVISLCISAFIYLALCGGFAVAAPVRHLIFDVDETLVQRDQEYKLVDGQLVPFLEQINTTFADPSTGETVSKIYYLRPGVRQFLEYAVAKAKAGQLDINVMSKKHQYKLNPLLQQIKFDDGKSLFDYVRVAYGREALKQFSKLNYPQYDHTKKDLSLIFHPKTSEYWNHLKRGDVSWLSQMEAFKTHIPNDTLMLDDSDVVIARDQRDHGLTIRYVADKDEAFWKKYQTYAAEEFPPLEELDARENFMAKLDMEREQYKIIQWMMEEADKDPLPNTYEDWNKMINAPEVLVTEKTHFKYLIADLLKDDDANTDLVILGRDGDLFYEALDRMKAELGVKSKLHYLPLSRIITTYGDKIVDVFKAIGVDTDGVKNGTRKLRLVDTGYTGTVPRRVTRAFFAKDPHWQRHVKDVSAFLFTAQTPGRDVKPEAHNNLEGYLAASGMIETTPHQFRLRRGELREVVLYWERRRPKKSTRPYLLDKNNKIVLTDSHPTENRFARLLDYLVRDFYGDPDHVKPIKDRIEFMRQPDSSRFPSYWRKEEPDIAKLDLSGDVTTTMTLKEAIREPLAKLPFLVTSWLKGLPPRKWAHDFLKFMQTASDPRERGSNKYDNDLSPDWVAYLEDRNNAAKSFFDYEPSYAAGDVSVGGGMLARARAEVKGPLKTTEFRSIGETNDFLLSIAAQFSQDTSKSLFRGLNLPDHGVDKVNELPKNWFWFVNWLYTESNRANDAASIVALAARVHYILAGRMVPFAKNNMKITHEIIGELLARKGRRLPDWAAKPVNPKSLYGAPMASHLETVVNAMERIPINWKADYCGYEAGNM